jgi:DNA-binding GntR family transcriptional regulator
MSVESFAADHTEMVAAIEARDAEYAERVGHAHATQFRGRFMQFLERNVSAEMRLEGTLPTALSS